MLSKLRLILCGASLMLAAAAPAIAQKPAEAAENSPAADAPDNEFQKLMGSIDWKTEGAGPLGSIANLNVPTGYRFTGSAGTIKLMEAFGNLTNGTELGYISPLDMGGLRFSSSIRPVM